MKFLDFSIGKHKNLQVDFHESWEILLAVNMLVQLSEGILSFKREK